MDVTFSSKKLQKVCNSAKKLRGDYGDRMASKIQTRLLDLSAVDSLDVMRSLPGRCHELTANLSGHLAVDLVQPMRLIFRPDHDPVPRRDDGSLIWEDVTKITVVKIDNYHD